MRVLPLHKRLIKYLKKHDLQEIFAKQMDLFEENSFHPSLHTEVLEPKHSRIYSFRVTKRYRAIFIYTGKQQIEIIDINDHYQ
jgi:plasmid maintenance system killer protein